MPQIVRRRDSLNRCAAALILLLLLASPVPVSGQLQERVPFRDRVVDLAILRDGTRLSGVTLPRDRPQLLVARAWLQQNALPFYTDQVEPQLTALSADRQNRDPLLQRLDEQLQELQQAPERDVRRMGLLAESIRALRDAGNGETRLLILDFSQVPPRRIVTQRVRSQQLGFLALLNDIPDVESSSWQTVAQKVEEIPAARRRTSLPGSDGDEIRQQADLILATVDYRGGVISRFISTGAGVIPEDGTPDVSALLTDLLGQSLQNQLNELLNPEGTGRPAAPGAVLAAQVLPDAARRQAESRGHRTLLISSFEIQLEAGGAIVRRSLFRRGDDDQWSLVTTVTGQGNAAELTVDQRNAIRADPQIERVTAVFSSLGITVGDLDRALQLGAVVQSAAQKAQAALEEAVSAAAQGHLPGRSAPSIPVITLRAGDQARK